MEILPGKTSLAHLFKYLILFQ